MQSHPLPLARYPGVRVTNLDAAAASYRAATGSELRVTPRRGARAFGWEVHYAQLGAVTLSSHRFDGAFSAKTAAAEAGYGITLPTGLATGACRYGSESVGLVDGRAAAISSPGQEVTVGIDDGYVGFNIDIAGDDLARAFTALSGVTPQRPLQFLPGMALEAPAVAAFVRAVRFAIDEADAQATSYAPPLLASHVSEIVMFRLLLAQPHDHSALLAKPPPAAEPAYVRRAAEYLDAHARDPVRLTDVALAVGVSVRALQRGFVAHRGCTPREFLQRRRLAIARALLVSGAYPSVSESAFAAGFEHLGRFSASYRAAYGESPSATLAKAR